jgi:hypothetical protein
VGTFQARTSQLLMARAVPKGICASSSAATRMFFIILIIFSVHAICIFFQLLEADGTTDPACAILWISVPFVAQLPALLDVRATSLNLQVRCFFVSKVSHIFFSLALFEV